MNRERAETFLGLLAEVESRPENGIRENASRPGQGVEKAAPRHGECNPRRLHRNP